MEVLFVGINHLERRMNFKHELDQQLLMEKVGHGYVVSMNSYE
jgi:hypothetical protein